MRRRPTTLLVYFMCLAVIWWIYITANFVYVSPKPTNWRECKTLTNVTGIDVNIGEQFGLHGNLPGKEHHLFVYYLLRKWCDDRKDPLAVVDVGANEGGVGGFAAAVGAKVLGVEALPSNMRKVERLNASLSRATQQRWRVFQCAAGDEVGYCFRLAKCTCVSSEILQHSQRCPAGARECHCGRE